VDIGTVDTPMDHKNTTTTARHYVHKAENPNVPRSLSEPRKLKAVQRTRAALNEIEAAHGLGETRADLPHIDSTKETHD